jgi:hypothetical protein
MKRNTGIARVAQTEAGLERIKKLEEQLAPTPMNSPRRRAIRAAIRIEAGIYRKSLDAEQATATHDAAPRPTVGLIGPGPLKRKAASRKKTPS